MPNDSVDEPSEEDKAEFAHICVAMKEYTKPFLAGVYGVFADSFGELVGTGSFVDLDVGSGISTAGHVLSARHALDAEGQQKYEALRV